MEKHRHQVMFCVCSVCRCAVCVGLLLWVSEESREVFWFWLYSGPLHGSGQNPPGKCVIYLFNIVIISLEPSCYNTMLWTAVNDICFLIMLWLHCKCDSAILSASCRWWRFSTLCCCARNWTSAQLWWCVHSTLCSTGSMSLRSGKKAWRTRRV